MRALVYFRRKGETTYRKLGPQEMSTLPPKGADVTVDVGGEITQARVKRGPSHHLVSWFPKSGLP